MNLYIDSTNPNQITVKIDNKIFVQEIKLSEDKDIFRFIRTCVSQSKLTPQDINQITVNPGPGSFTGSRIGVAIANSLGYALSISVNGTKSPIEAIYSEPPHITTSKPASVLS